MKFLFLIVFLFLLLIGKAQDSTLVLVKEISGKLTPKSVVYSGNGLFFAQNMMYKHTVRVYNSDYELVKSISDKINLKDFGGEDKELSGAPVEAAFSHKGKYAWVSNYNMTGEDYTKPGCDACRGDGYDNGFVYKINTESLEIENIIEVGAIPKYMAVSSDNKKLLVSNWTSGDVSIIDLDTEKEIKRISVGIHPRGIAITKDCSKAYITIMGSSRIVEINLRDYSKKSISDVGRAPRHLCIDDEKNVLYATINGEGKLIKIDLNSNSIVASRRTGRAPRTMVLSKDKKYLYVVNYLSNTLSKVSTETFEEMEEVPTNSKPIGVTFSEKNNEVWVACYSGSLIVFKDVGIKEENSIDLTTLSSNTSMAKAFNYKEIAHKIENKKQLEKEPEIKMEAVIKEKQAKNIVEEKKPVKRTENGNYYVIVGSFKNKSNAQKLVKKLQSQGLTSKELKSQKQGFTYAAIGGFNSRENAQQQLNNLKGELSGWVYKQP